MVYIGYRDAITRAQQEVTRRAQTPAGAERLSDEEIARVEYALNTRPRKRLGWKTPLEVFLKELNRTNNRIKINNNIASVAITG